MVTTMYRNRRITRGDIYYVERDMEISRGHEQQPGRPGVIVSDFSAGGGNTCMVVYLTTKRDRPDPGGLHIEIGSAPKPSIALCDQIKTVDTRRLDKCCGHVTDEEMAQIDDAIRRALGLEEEAPRNTYAPKPWRDVRRAAETDQLEEQLAEAKEQAESWRRMALHLMERSA